MAKNPKIKDPTEVALSAIQDALNIGDMPPSDGRSESLRNSGLAPDLRGDNDDPRFNYPPANDDRATIGAMLQVIQKGRPRRSAYTLATLFAGLWVIGGGVLIFLFLPALEAMIGAEGGGGVLALVGLGLLFLAPLILFYSMASLAWRGQELSLIAQSMAHMAVRFSEPENVASDGMTSVGQAIRREIAAMGDGVERAIARAGELEALVSNEVSSLERAYSDNEQRIRGLLDDIAVQRDNLAGQAEQVRNAISSVQIDLRQDIALISDSIAARVDEVAQSITGALEERTEHITRAMSNAGDSIVIALGERGGDLLDRLEDASTQTAAAVLDATERLTASLDFKTGSVHDEFADLADKVHDMLNERIDRVTASFEEKSNAIVDGIAARTDQVHSNISGAGDTLLARLDSASDDLAGRLDGVGDKLAERILASGEKASDALDVTVNTLVAKVVSQTESAHEVLTGQIASFDGLVREQGAELAERFSRDSTTLGALITRHVAEFDRTVKTYGGEIVERIGQHSSGLSDNLKTYETAFESRIGALENSLGAKVTSFDDTVAARLRNFEDSFDTRATSITSAIDSRTISISQAIDSRSAAITEAIDTRTTSIAEVIDSRTNNLAGTITARFQEMHDGLEMRFGAVVTDVAARVSQFETLLDHRVEAAAHRVTSSGQQAAEVMALRSEELMQGIRARVEDADRSLTSLMTDTSEAIQGGARAAQQSLLTLSSEVGTHLKATVGDVERTVQTAAREAENTLILASTNASAQIHSSSAEIERTVQAAAREAANSLALAATNASAQMHSSSAEIERTVQAAAREAENTLQIASNNSSAQMHSSSAEIERTIAAATVSYGATVSNRVEAITDSVREQSERLTQMIDEKRGTLVQGLGAKSDEIAITIGSATESALKSIESHGGAFTVAMMNNSSDLARQINTASEVAIGAVNKSLKDIELASRSAIDQSRQVATTTVNELQETSKILRTDTLALFERLREGNILLQEVLTGAHDNLNNLERTLVTRVADFVTTMNDVTARNGASTSALEQQLGVFNTSTAGALDNLGSLAAQFETHGQALAQAAALVDQSNASTERSVAERNATLEQLINTIDLRTLDMDERLHRFTSLLDESLEAAESRARDIAKVVAETAGASSSAVSRQFEAVRMAVEDERRQTSEAMSEIYDQGTREADAMFRQAADKFSSIVHGMKQMAGELHSELDATRAELRRGVLDMPQEAAESTAQMRKVIVDQIEALAELNRIVARHGNGLDVASAGRNRAREEEPMLVAAGSVRQESRPAPRGPAPRDNSASALPPPDFGPAPRRTEAPSVAPVNGEGGGWLSEMLNRGDEPARNARAAPSNPLESLALDITRLVDRDLAAEMWDRYQRGERKAFTKRLYTSGGQKAFDEVARKYRADRAFKQTVDRYINEFEKLLDEISREERGPAALRSQLTSETGLVYTLLAHAAGRLG